MKSIYPKSYMFNAPKELKFMTDLSPLKRPEFKVELIQVGDCEKEIDYSKADKVGCVQVGTHIKQ